MRTKVRTHSASRFMLAVAALLPTLSAGFVILLTSLSGNTSLANDGNARSAIRGSDSFKQVQGNAARDVGPPDAPVANPYDPAMIIPGVRGLTGPGYRACVRACQAGCNWISDPAYRAWCRRACRFVCQGLTVVL